LIAPDLLIAELCNAAWRLWRRREITREQVSIVATRIPYLFADNAPMDRLAARAAAIALNLDHPVYGCFYLALAEREDVKMVTADRRLVSRVSGTPWEHHTVGLEDSA
jgi:predicted nucleic acid-binding protein